MATEIGIGISSKLDSFNAGKDAARIASNQIGTHHPNILIVFISPIFHQEEAIKGIRSVMNEAPLVGCSTVCSITTSGAYRDSVTLCAIYSNEITFSYGIETAVSKNPRSAGRKAALQSSKPKDLSRQAYIMFSDCFAGNMADVLRGAQEILGTSFPIIGGCGTDLKFQKSYQYLNNNINTDSIVWLLISGNIKIGTGNAHGWQPIGKPHTITKARFNIVKEIDRKKAIELYEEYLGKTSDDFLRMGGFARIGSSYPLGMQLEGKREYLTMAPLKIKDDGSLMLNAEIPERKDVNLMIGDVNLTLEATEKACTDALDINKTSRPKFAIIFSDIARFRLLLRGYLQRDIEIIKELLGKDVPFFGCYTFGEYAPIDIQEFKGQSYFQNQIISVVVFSE